MNLQSVKDFFDIRPQSRSVIIVLNYVCDVFAVVYPVYSWLTGLMTFSTFSLITSLIPLVLSCTATILFRLGKFNYGGFLVFLLLPASVFYKTIYEQMIALMLAMLAFGISGFLTLQKKAAINLTYLIATICYMQGYYLFEMKYNTQFPKAPLLNMILYFSFPAVVYINLRLLLRSIEDYEVNLKMKRDELQMQNTILENQNEEILNQSHQIILRQKLLDEAAVFSGKIGMILSHDVRMPLKALENIFTSYNEGMISKEDLASVAPAIEKDIKYVNSIFIDVLELAKEQKKEKQARMEYFQLKVITNEICDAYYSVARKKNIFISNQVQTDEKVYFNIKYYKIILRNLLANALKFTPATGWVKIYTEHQVNNMVKITVEDNGIGISKEDMVNLKRGLEIKLNENSSDGMGIGLAFCNDLLKSGNSALQIESEADKGSKFSFSLPIKVIEKEFA